jgi:tetratricopeptide (TPR) repeat protein
MAMAPRALGMLLLSACLVSASAQAAPPSQQKPPDSSTTTARKNGQITPETAGPGKQAPGAVSDKTAGSKATDSANADLADDRNFSSSRETVIDISPPKDDRKDHPNSALPEDDESDADTDVQEFHQWNPMKALKAIEIGDYYFKRKNYRAALDRYKEALQYKENDAVATFRLAQCQERMGDRQGALDNYAAYLKILPNGPSADEARDSIEDLKAEKGHL